MTLNSAMTVRDLALELSQAKRVLERVNIDYCCGGERLLGEACASAGVELSTLETMLDDAAAEEFSGDDFIDFQNLTLSELITHILDKHHVFTRQEMARLGTLTNKVISAHGANHPELHRIGELFQQLCADLEPHMLKEEKVLFPYIIAMESAALQDGPAPSAPFGTVKNPVRMMMSEHETVGDLLRELRKLSSDYTVPADGCISYQTLYQALAAFEKDLHQHIHLENNILFPKAVAMEEAGSGLQTISP